MSNFSTQVFANPTEQYKSTAEVKNEADILQLQTDLTVAENDILSNLGFINQNITDIGTNDTDIAALQAADIVIEGKADTALANNASNLILINTNITDILALQNNFERQVINGTWSNNTAVSAAVDIIIINYLGQIIISMDAIPALTGAATPIPFYVFNQLVPVSLRPAATVKAYASINDSGAGNLASVSTLDSAGVLRVFRDPDETTNWAAGPATHIVGGSSISYSI